MIFDDPRPPRRRRLYWTGVCVALASAAIWLTGSTAPLWAPEIHP